MEQRLRFLLDTNILLPLQDSMIVLEKNLANFVRLASIGGHQLLYHPASIDDIQRDKNNERKDRTLSRLNQYSMLENIASSPSNTEQTSANDRCDNDIIYALQCSAVHALITEDKQIHIKARNLGLGDKVYNIQTAEDWLRRLHEPREVFLPNIEDVPIYSFTNQLRTSFFNSLRENYAYFDQWFHKKAQTGRRAWVVQSNKKELEAICIYDKQQDIVINDKKDTLHGTALKLCTFKVGENARGKKIGELFLKAAFLYATENLCEHIFTHTNREQIYLLNLLEDFGFQEKGIYGSDLVLVKEHPRIAPAVNLSSLQYAKHYFPHYRSDLDVSKFFVPIKPVFHEILFPEISLNAHQLDLFSVPVSSASNAIKQAYLCKAQTNKVQPGDLVVFYRTSDQMAATTLGIVEQYKTLNEPMEIMQLVRRRTVYSQKEIEEMAKKPIKVMLFRLIKHFSIPVLYEQLMSEKIIAGPIQSITNISHASFNELLNLSRK